MLLLLKPNLETFAGAESVVAKALETYGRVDVLHQQRRRCNLDETF